MEQHDDKQNYGKLKVVIVDYTKKKSPAGDRYLPLIYYEINLPARQINKEAGYCDDDFIFCDEEGRTTSREIDNCIRAQCNPAEIEVKSAHDIRRTVASEMDRNGVPIKMIRWFLGHIDIATTRGYILNNQGKEKTKQIVIESLSGMNGIDVLKRTQIN